MYAWMKIPLRATDEILRPQLEMVGDSFERGGDTIVAGGIRIFQFRTLEAGSHRLNIRNGVIGKEKVRE
jgi:hypothetical protein